MPTFKKSTLQFLSNDSEEVRSEKLRRLIDEYNQLVRALAEVGVGEGGGGGGDGADGDPAIDGFATLSTTAAWSRDPSNVWTPASDTSDMMITFRLGATDLARVGRRITRAADGTLTVSTIPHSGGDLNIARVSVVVLNAGARAITVRPVYEHDSRITSFSQNFIAAVSGGAGAEGGQGSSYAELTIYRRASSPPATPTGGQYDFDTRVFTPPAGWSSAVPAGTDPVYISRTIAFSADSTGVDASLTWALPALAFREGDSVTIIYIRSATQPATPDPSAIVPVGWSSSIAATSGSDPLWSSFGTRPNAGEDWTWQAPVRFEGLPGTDGDPGAPGADGDDAVVLDSRDWVIPVATPMGQWVGAGGLTNSVTEMLRSPRGSTTLGMRLRGTDPASAPGWFGRWHGTFPVDPQVSYLAIMFVRRRSAGTTRGLYIGWNTGSIDNQTASLAGTNTPNPYSAASNLGPTMIVDRWYLAAQILHGVGATVSSGKSGLYDMITGEQIYAGSEFRHFNDAVTSQIVRFGFYSNTTNFDLDDGFEVLSPVVYAMLGNEPDIDTLLGRRLAFNSVAIEAFASNIDPVLLHSGAQPAVTYLGSDVVLWLNDGKLYRWNGASYAATIPASDLTGTVNLNSQISGTLTAAFAEAGLINSNITVNADGTITGAGGGQVQLNSLPGQIGGTQITDGSITTPKIGANQVTALLMAAGSITAANAAIANAAILTANIGDAQITDAKIASLQVDKLTTGTLSAGITLSGSIIVASTGFIRSGQTAYATGTGWWLGNDAGTPRFSIGDNTNYLRWNGTALEVGGAIIGPSNINAANLASIRSFTGTLTADLIRTASAGPRLEISNVGLFPIWYGDGAKTAENAKFYVSTSGEPYFEGSVVVADEDFPVVGRNSAGHLVQMHPLQFQERVSDPPSAISATNVQFTWNDAGGPSGTFEWATVYSSESNNFFRAMHRPSVQVYIDVMFESIQLLGATLTIELLGRFDSEAYFVLKTWTVQSGFYFPLRRRYWLSPQRAGGFNKFDIGIRARSAGNTSNVRYISIETQILNTMPDLTDSPFNIVS